MNQPSVFVADATALSASPASGHAITQNAFRQALKSTIFFQDRTRPGRLPCGPYRRCRTSWYSVRREAACVTDRGRPHTGSSRKSRSAPQKHPMPKRASSNPAGNGGARRLPFTKCFSGLPSAAGPPGRASDAVGIDFAWLAGHRRILQCERNARAQVRPVRHGMARARTRRRIRASRYRRRALVGRSGWLTRSLPPSRRKAPPGSTACRYAAPPCQDRATLKRAWIEGRPCRSRPRNAELFALRARPPRRLHRAGLAHNDLAKEPNWLVTPTGLPALVDFQLAFVSPRRGAPLSNARARGHPAPAQAQAQLLSRSA